MGGERGQTEFWRGACAPTLSVRDTCDSRERKRPRQSVEMITPREHEEEKWKKKARLYVRL